MTFTKFFHTLLILFSILFSQEDTIRISNIQKYTPDHNLWWIDTLKQKIYLLDNEIIGCNKEVVDALIADTNYYHPLTGMDSVYYVFHGKEKIDFSVYLAQINGSTFAYKRDLANYEANQKLWSFSYKVFEIEEFGSSLVSAYKNIFLGVDKWTSKNNGYFLNWTLNDSFFVGKYKLQKMQPDYEWFDSLYQEIQETPVYFLFKYLLESYDSLATISSEMEKECNPSSSQLGPMVILLNRLKDAPIPPVLFKPNGALILAKRIQHQCDSILKLKLPSPPIGLRDVILFRSKEYVLINDDKTIIPKKRR